MLFYCSSLFRKVKESNVMGSETNQNTFRMSFCFETVIVQEKQFWTLCVFDYIDARTSKIQSGLLHPNSEKPESQLSDRDGRGY